MSDDPLMLPRVLDTCQTSPVEFEGWLTGIASTLPRRAVATPTPGENGILAE
jgi:hypothetical protein